MLKIIELQMPFSKINHDRYFQRHVKCLTNTLLNLFKLVRGPRRHNRSLHALHWASPLICASSNLNRWLMARKYRVVRMPMRSPGFEGFIRFPTVHTLRGNKYITT